MGEELCLVDTATKQTFSLREGDPEYIVSAATLHRESVSLLVIPPSDQDQSYNIKIIRGQPLSLELVTGVCTVNGRSLVLATPLPLSPGAFITLGSRSLQCVCPGTSQQTPRRVLPPTPGQTVRHAPPSKPRRQKQQQSEVGVSLARIEPMSPTNQTDHGIRQRLQRIAAEVSARLIGYEGRKPPPPYEQVGNSIGYQILHQQKRDLITSALIDALYPALKESELKDPSLQESYSVYVQAFSEALEKPASLTCMLPADLPTCDFVVDMLLHLCCMPHMTALAEKHGELWCQLLALFSQSQQNQIHMASKRHPTKVLSCMHLKIMSCKSRFQQYGWTVLANTVSTATPPDGKPVLSEPSLTLALSLCESQLATCSSDISLVVAVVQFLAQVATTAKLCASHGEEERAYSEEQAMRILNLFQEKLVLRHVMKVPPHLRLNTTFEQAYSRLVKALVPVRGQPGSAAGVRGVADGSADVCVEGDGEVGSGGVADGRDGGVCEEGDSEAGSGGVTDGHDGGVCAEGDSEAGSGGVVDGGDGVCTEGDSEAGSLCVEGKGREAENVALDNVEIHGAEDDSSLKCEPVGDGAGAGDQTGGVAGELDGDSAGEQGRGDNEQSCVTSETVELIGNDSGPSSQECMEESNHKPGTDAQTSSVGSILRVNAPSSDLSPPAITPSDCVSPCPPCGNSVSSTSPGHKTASLSNDACTSPATPLAMASFISDSLSQPSPSGHANHSSPQKDTTLLPHCNNSLQPHSSPGDELMPGSSPGDALMPGSSPSDEFMPGSRPGDRPTLDSSLNSNHIFASSSTLQDDTTASVVSDSTTASSATLQDDTTASVVSDSTTASSATLQDNTAASVVSYSTTVSSATLQDDTAASVVSDSTTVSSAILQDNTAASVVSDSTTVSSATLQDNTAASVVSDSTTVSSATLQDATTATVVSDSNASDDCSSQRLSPSFPATTPPLTPTTATLAVDVQELLNTLSTPLEPCVVKVPSLSLRGRYYRHSFKKVSFKQKHSTVSSQESNETLSESVVSTSSRGQWGESGEQPSMVGQDEADLFEVSGVFLSSHHSALEEVIAGHSDMLHTLQSRVELLKGVLSLWTSGKGLQAATNLLQGCFSEDSSDERMLFVETIRCFLSHQASWTLAVCLVLLPPIHQLLTTQTHKQIIGVTSDAVLMIINKFSELILACKVASPTRKRWRLSSSVDREQQLVCYKELHGIQQSLHARLNTNQDSLQVANKLRKVHAALIPFKRL